jgi:1,4-alpha-glucan branching enzyme
MDRNRRSVVLVLHAHLPWVVGTREERWLHEAVLDCYLPLLDVLERSPKGRLTLSVTPVLAAMLDHGPARERSRAFIEMARIASTGWHRDAATTALKSFDRGPIIERLAALARDGTIELITSGVTHGFLPLLMGVPAAARAQIALGVEAHRRMFGAEPGGFWLPECGYCEGLDRLLADCGVRYIFVDSHAVGSTVRGTAAPVYLPSGVAAFARDVTASEQVWSSRVGYPADFVYADFHHRIDGQRVLRITGSEPKEPWDPDVALQRATEHAAHFIESRRDGTELQVAPYDAELFGHWWLEGPTFLEQVLQSGLLTTPSAVLAAEPTLQTLQLPFSSWGRAGTAEVWLGPHNAWMWPHLHRAAEEMMQLKGPIADAALPELLLAQASDWPFLIDAKTSAGFAHEQFEQHLLAFRAIARGEEVRSTNPFPWARASVYLEAGGGKAQPEKGGGTARAGADAPGARRVGEDRRGARSSRR